jgi:outer membrane protein assembly factor BamB
VNLLNELSCESPALGLDWARNEGTGEISLGVATRGGKFYIFNPQDGTVKEDIDLDPPTPIWRVAGNRSESTEEPTYALATLDGGVIGVQEGKGVKWQHPFGSSCGAIAFTGGTRGVPNLIIAGSLDRSLRGIDPITGKLVWGAMFPTGVGFVDLFEIESGLVLIAGDTAGAVRCYKATSGEMQWYADFQSIARFCVPLNKPETAGELLWMAGTDEKLVHIFSIEGEKAGEPSVSVPCIEYPWQARRLGLDSTVVAMYNFANLLGDEPSAAGQLVAFRDDGAELWSTTIVGSAEDMVAFNRGESNSSTLYVGTTVGTVLQVDASNGEVGAVLPLASEPINALRILPASDGAEITLAAACDDGRVFLIGTSP